MVEARLAQRFGADANDYIYSYEAARDYDPSPDLEKITARVLAINAADDERNPAELGILDREIKRVKNGRYVSDPGVGGNARPRHHRRRQVLEASAPPVAERRDAGGAVRRTQARLPAGRVEAAAPR